MTTIKQVPAGLLHALGLHKGDFLTVKDESPGAFVIEITRTSAEDAPVAQADHRQAALASFAAGVGVAHFSTEEELDEARYEHLRSKHLK